MHTLTPPWYPQQCIRAQSHGGVNRVIQMEHSQSQCREASHEGSLETTRDQNSKSESDKPEHLQSHMKSNSHKSLETSYLFF